MILPTFDHKVSCVNSILNQYLPTQDNTLSQAMRYSVNNGGKRLRPLLLMETCGLYTNDFSKLPPLMAAVEFIHCYSLIHDDLPAMDNDTIRRGQPTCHIKFGEAIAILAGDALQSLSFECLCGADFSSDDRLKMIHLLSVSIGCNGMAAGQALDIAAQGQSISIESCQKIHELKTASLISASVLIGAIAGGCQKPDEYRMLEKFSNRIGLAFQIQDDLIGISQLSTTTGKTQGIDAARKQPNYASLLPRDKAAGFVKKLHEEALDSLQLFSHKADNLRLVSRQLVERNC